ncbi:hypothetical protein I545_0647 [Mycobacterium kansasii 662]|uniref:Uncharacterized protein n=3 Tax=Mycobacterium kansasii TaxID=1768 RepID=A0A1V3XRZ8_MYCKA|nr:hypothetical protein MKAN_22435 [Mycobacterium kansasii ATCC 12478]EUA05612.1 hypothetical protein I547_0689 [Mycobacterium kansasii 824]EUA21640.1 hypothetical protein I545_0647 [Mycobacterium kansasii 662]KEP43186.1 hypothetical protein MKSMC1_15730 [Mycobacterium kansasii]OOK81850.1 hypothetical protein BZL30_1165 [Mycobacterium kansasii]
MTELARPRATNLADTREAPDTSVSKLPTNYRETTMTLGICRNDE